MAHICQVHPYEVAEGLCRSCGGPFCADCLVYPFGPTKPPYCVPCAVTAAGVRRSARNPRVVVPKETKRRLKEWRKARKRDLQSPSPDGIATWQKMDDAEAVDDEEAVEARDDAEREALRLPPPQPETPTPPPGVNLAPPGPPGHDWRDEIDLPGTDELGSVGPPVEPFVEPASWDPPQVDGESAPGAGWAGHDAVAPGPPATAVPGEGPLFPDAGPGGTNGAPVPDPYRAGPEMPAAEGPGFEPAPDAFEPAAFEPTGFDPTPLEPTPFEPAAFEPTPPAFEPTGFDPTPLEPTPFEPAAFEPAPFEPTGFEPTPPAFEPAPSGGEPSAFEPAFEPTGFETAAFESEPPAPAAAGFDDEPLAAFGLGGRALDDPLPPPPPPAGDAGIDAWPPTPDAAGKQSFDHEAEPAPPSAARPPLFPPPPAPGVAPLDPTTEGPITPGPTPPPTRPVAPDVLPSAIRAPTPTRIPAAPPEDAKSGDAKAMLARIAALRGDKDD